MSKQLIVDYIPFEILPEQISESMKENEANELIQKAEQ